MSSEVSYPTIQLPVDVTLRFLDRRFDVVFRQDGSRSRYEVRLGELYVIFVQFDLEKKVTRDTIKNSIRIGRVSTSSYLHYD